MKLDPLLAAAVFVSQAAYSAEEKSSGQEILAVAKIAGACGIISSLLEFQKATQIPGGDAFLARFLAMEIARRGMAPKD